ncbi:MAG: HAMP domain-containing protein [Gemmataceae bacterium]|nr:HAMP domain-containing protein [Gemmataceae bacterium]
MRSIRLSLIVYFLLLLTGALGAVSWFSYRTTAESLHERQHDAQKMIQTQYEARSQAAHDSRKMIEAQYVAYAQAARAELDRHILRQARAMAGMPLVTVPYEAVYVASVLAAPTTPGNVSLQIWLPDNRPFGKGKDAPRPTSYVPFWAWLTQDQNKKQARSDTARFYPKFTHLQSSEHLVLHADLEHSQEYFQTYRTLDGQPMQRSESMGDSWFVLNKERRKQTLFTEYYDEVELKPGVKVTRVTLKMPVSGFGGVTFFGPWRGPPQTPGKGGTSPKGPPKAVDTKTPTLFIQYAADLAPLDEKTQQFAIDRDSQLAVIDDNIQQFATERDSELAKLERTIGEDLNQLRSRMLWIGMSALIALWFGGYVVIRLGLAPLSKMSEAVSQVSPSNFRLQLDVEKLPNELRPIAARLSEVLVQLQKAFAREKQAAADISHELRTPLAALMTNLEVGLKKSRSPAEYQEILEECRASGQHMYQLVERLLTLARLDAGADNYRPTEVDVTDAALQCADVIRPLAKARGIKLNLNLTDPIITTTDPNKLREILTNLLHNAVEYNKPNGTIDLSVERLNGHVRLQVRDTGIGIKPEALEHIFKRFYRADPSRHADTPHAGLGLSIVKSYVDLMGGTIEVEALDTGTAFIVDLPFVTPTPDLKTAVQAELEVARR